MFNLRFFEWPIRARLAFNLEITMDATNTFLNFYRTVLVVIASLLLVACGGSSGSGSDANTEIEIPGPRLLLPSLATYEPAFEDENHSGSAACSVCHTFAPDSTASDGIGLGMGVQGESPGEIRDVSIGSAWETSIMAQATRDPYWHAVVASELDNFPMQEEKINDECLVCHAPTAHDLAAKQGLDLRLYDKVDEETGETLPGIYGMDDSDRLFNHAMDGVTCTLCHQMEDTNFGTEESMTGGYDITGPIDGDLQTRPAYGQYADPDISYMLTQSNFLPLQGAHLSTSESCATCHNLNIEPIDPDGNLIEGAHFAEQAIYTEWLNSDFAIGGPQEASCQSCHMPVLDEEVFIAEGAPDRRPDFAEHTFLGANTVMQDMFKNFSTELGIDLNVEAPDDLGEEAAQAYIAEEVASRFDESIARNRAFLTSSATVSLSQGSIDSDTLDFDVTIENRTGHKLPAGYHSRRVFLHVQVLDADGELVFESGEIRDDGSIVGVIEDVNPDTFEPHYDVITDATQVQVYQAIMGDLDGNRTHSLLAGTQYLKDNRLTPSGFDKDIVAADTTLADTFGTFGNALGDDNFNNGRDVVSFQLDVSDSTFYTVIAELRYQPLNYGHLQQLWTQGDTLDQVDMFRTIYNSTELRSEFIDTDTLILQ